MCYSGRVTVTECKERRSRKEYGASLNSRDTYAPPTQMLARWITPTSYSHGSTKSTVLLHHDDAVQRAYPDAAEVSVGALIPFVTSFRGHHEASCWSQHAHDKGMIHS